MKAPLVRVELWSNLQCASGVPLAYVQKVLSASAALKLRGDSRVSFTCPLDDAAIASVTMGRVTRFVYADDTWDEWRIDKPTTEATRAGDVRRAECASPMYELGAAGPIIEYDAAGVPSFAGFRYGMTPSDVISTVIIPWLTAKGLTWVALGTVDPTAPIDIEWADVTPLGLLHQLEELAGCEAQLRRNGTTSYLLDLLTETNSAAPVADLREGKNLLGTVLTEDATQRYSEIVGLGASDPAGRRAALGRAVWEVSAVDTGTDILTLVDPEGGADPIIEDDQLNGLWLYDLPTGRTDQILDTFLAPNSVEVADASLYAVGDLLEVRDSAGTGTYKDDAQILTSLTRPSVTPIRVGMLDRPDLPGERNLVPNGWFTDWTGGADAAPDGWTLSLGARTLAARDSTYAQIGPYTLALRYRPYTITSGTPTLGDTVLLTTDTDGFYVGQAVQVRDFNAASADSRTVTAVSPGVSITIDSGISYTPSSASEIYELGFQKSPNFGFPRVESGWVRAPVTGGALFFGQVALLAMGFPTAGYKFTLHVEVGNPSGIYYTTSSVTTITDQWVTLGVPIQATAGQYMRLAVTIEADQTVIPPVAPGDLASTHALYLDAMSLTQTDYQPASIPNYSFGNALWHAVNQRLLASRVGASYDVQLVDLTALDAAGWPDDELLLGATVRVNQASSGYVNELLRIQQIDRPNLFAPAQCAVVLGERPQDLTELIDRAIKAATASAAPPGSGGGSGPPGGGGGGGVTPVVSTTLLKTIIGNVPGHRVRLEAMPVAETDIGDDTHFLCDFTSTSAPFLSGVVTAAGVSGSVVRVQYVRPSDSSWQPLDGSAGPSLALDATGDITGTAVIPEADARGLRWCRVVSALGDGVAAPELGHLTLLTRATGGGGSIPVTPSPPPAVSDWQQLIIDLGGNAAVPFFYDFRYRVSVTGSNATGIDDVRGGSGFGPFLGYGTAAAYDATLGDGTFTAGDAMVSAHPFAGANLSGPFSLIYVGTVDGTGGGSQFVAAVGTPSGTPSAYLGIRADAGDIAAEALVGGTVTTATTTVACDAALVRVCVASQDGATGLTGSVLNAQASTTMAGTPTATSAHIALMERTNADFGNRGEGTVRALIGVAHDLSPAELAAVLAWAVAHRGATAA